MAKKVALVIFSVLTLLGAFLPIASGGNFYVNISHLKGLAYLLYAIPLILLVLSVVNIYKDVKYIKIWFISTSILGFLILLYSTVVGINTINYIIQELLAFEKSRIELEKQVPQIPLPFEKNRSEFEKQFQEEKKKFEEEFNKGWGDSGRLKGDEGIKSEDVKHQEMQTSQQMSIPSAKPGLGTYLMGLGFLGVFGLNLISIRQK